MKKYLTCLFSIIELFCYKAFHWKRLRIEGVPVCMKTRNLKVEKGGVLHIGRLVNVSSNTVFSCLKNAFIRIGDNVYFNRSCSIVSRGNINIGNQCRFGPNICLFDHDHVYGLDGVTDNYKTGSITIGERCWIGANAVILRDSEIGDGCVIGAGVVFKGKLPPHSLVYNDKSRIMIKPIIE